jgi:hypothetical protein
MSKSSTIPDGSGAITVTGFEQAVNTHKVNAQYAAHLAQQLEAAKAAFRTEAERRLAAASPGTTRVEFTDGQGGCVMVSPLDLESQASRKLLDTRLLQQVAANGLEVGSKVEERHVATVTGETVALLAGMTGKPCIVLTGEVLIQWFTGIFSAKGQPLPEGAVGVIISEDDVDLRKEQRLTQTGATELRAKYRELLTTGGDDMSEELKEAVQAFAAAALKSAAVNVR